MSQNLNNMTNNLVLVSNMFNVSNTESVYA